MAEREGFEPSEQVTPLSGLANRRTRPLCDLSNLVSEERRIPDLFDGQPVNAALDGRIDERQSGQDDRAGNAPLVGARNLGQWTARQQAAARSIQNGNSSQM